MADAPADPRIGTVIDNRYRIVDRVAAGGMGVVYRAERLQLGRTVAIKFLDAANAADENSRARFEREAKAMSMLSHPHCVSVIDFGVSGTPFIVMDYVTGQPLVSLIYTKKKVGAERSVSIMKQVMAGLAHAHGHEIIHRDVKPANIMLTEATGTGDFVRILDFGLAKLRGARSLSSSNIVVGTPSYMSPEQGAGTELDVRTDVYSAGVVLFELLTGEKPFIGGDAFEILRMHQQDPVPLLGTIKGSDEIRIALDAVIQQALAKKPRNRFQTALDMGEALARIEDSNRPERPVGKRSSKKKDLARATTQLPAEPAPGPEGTEVLASSTRTKEPSERKGKDKGAVSGFLKTIAVLGALGVLGILGWNYWSQYTKDNAVASTPASEPAIDHVATAPSLDGALLVEASEASEASEPAAANAMIAAALDDAGGDDAAADAGPTLDAAPDASTLAFDLDATVIDAPTTVEVSVGHDPEDPDETDETEERIATALPSGPPKTASQVRALAAAGQTTGAIRGLAALIRESPKSAYLHRTMGDLNVERGWFSEALKNYTKAVRLSPRYKRFKSINESAIAALGMSKVRRRAERFIRNELGSSALVHLRAAVRQHPSPRIRTRAAALIKQIR